MPLPGRSWSGTRREDEEGGRAQTGCVPFGSSGPRPCSCGRPLLRGRKGWKGKGRGGKGRKGKPVIDSCRELLSGHPSLPKFSFTRNFAVTMKTVFTKQHLPSPSLLGSRVEKTHVAGVRRGVGDRERPAGIQPGTQQHERRHRAAAEHPPGTWTERPAAAPDADWAGRLPSAETAPEAKVQFSSPSSAV